MRQETSGFESYKARSDVNLQNIIEQNSAPSSLVGYNHATFTSHIPEEQTEEDYKAASDV